MQKSLDLAKKDFDRIGTSCQSVFNTDQNSKETENKGISCDILTQNISTPKKSDSKFKQIIQQQKM